MLHSMRNINDIKKIKLISLSNYHIIVEKFFKIDWDTKL